MPLAPAWPKKNVRDGSYNWTPANVRRLTKVVREKGLKAVAQHMKRDPDDLRRVLERNGFYSNDTAFKLWVVDRVTMFPWLRHGHLCSPYPERAEDAGAGVDRRAGLAGSEDLPTHHGGVGSDVSSAF